MVDLSTYFRIHNRLDVDLQLDDTSQIHYGHWEKKPNDGLVPAFSVSEEFQIKDAIILPEGTEADLYFKGTRGDRKISVHIYVTCPWSRDFPNAADCAPEDSSQLLCSVSGFNSKEPMYHPLRVDFIIDRRVK